MKKKPYKLLFLGIIVACLLTLTACYRLGQPSGLSFKTIYVEPIENHTEIAQAQGLIATQIRKHLLLDSRLVVENNSNADVILSVVLKDYQQSVQATQENETGYARAFRYTLKASLSLFDNRQKKYIVKDHTIAVGITTYIDGGSQIATYQSIPPLTHELAYKIKEFIVSVW